MGTREEGAIGVGSSKSKRKRGREGWRRRKEVMEKEQEGKVKEADMKVGVKGGK